MDTDASTPSPQSYTILRIKRKRNEEPLDTLVVESRVRRKKSRGGAGVFQYAQTVEDGVWDDEKSQKDIQNRISRLAKEDAAKVLKTDPQSHLDTVVPTSPSCLKKEQTRRYTIISAGEDEPPTKRQVTTPPSVLASKDLPKHPPVPDFRMYDAILSEQKTTQASIPDPEMEKFLPLLNDYLKIHDIHTNTVPSNAATEPRIKSRIDALGTDSDDYVWDVFYHRPASLSEWSAVAARTGTITGLPGSALDSDDSESDSEADDEADEDSNAEEYYKNDYPDEESGTDPEHSDEFHEGSDYDDGDYHDHRDF